ncbi:MAG: hypothetical protein L6Q84_01275 [Polyangiaceae bacterium]|nr:hypothetical protein [Polyangiaceae bacterium]
MTRKRWAIIAAVAFALLLAVVAVFMQFFAEPMARRMAIQRAEEHGVVLEPGDIYLSLGSVSVRRSRFHLVGLPAVRGSLDELRVSLRGTHPVGVKLRGVEVEALGSAATLALGVAEWSRRFPQTFRLPTEVDAATLVWRKADQAEPWLTLSGGTVRRGGSTTHFSAEKSVLGLCRERDEGAALCPDLGQVGAAWTADDAQVAIGFGVDDLARAPVRLEVRHSLAEPTATITLSPVDLARLAGPFGSKLPVKGVTASATVQLVLPKGSGAVTGTLDASLKGYVPPHPRELDGLVFGDTTTLSAKLRVDEGRERAELSEVKVGAGAFKLAGTGSVFREADHGALRLDLSGSLPCSALAGAAAESHLGRALGGIAGQLARDLIKGSVAITVAITARSDELDSAKIDKKIGVGCGLRPIEIGGVDVTKILEGKLPPMPSGLPALPKIDLEIEPPKPKPKGTGEKQ